MKSLIMVAGPTASGKTSCALQIARENDGEIVCMDAFQVYRNLPIITAMPSLEEREQAPHHLFEVLELSEEFSVGKWFQMACDAILEIWERGKTPVLTGGTMMYVRIFLNGLSGSPEEHDPRLREELRNRLQVEGLATLYEELQKKDPKRAGQLHPNDGKRILRALEKLEEGPYARWHPLDGFSYEVKKILCCPPREILYDRINLRVEKMLEHGALEEVRQAFALGLCPGMTAYSCLGIRDLEAVLLNQVSLQEAREKLAQNTRRFAKRQMTWCRTEGPWDLWEYTEKRWRPHSDAFSRLAPMD